MDDASVVAARIAAAAVVFGGLVGAGLLLIAAVLVSRRIRGLPATEVYPDRSVPAPVVIVLLCLCVPFALIAWFPEK